MNAQLIKLWDRLRSSFWFLPALMSAAAVALAVGGTALDGSVQSKLLQSMPWAYTGGAAGASLVLSTIASSMVTIAGVVFSMTLVALSLASSQLGPRLLRNFMRDRVNQVVLGTFVSTFIYCLLVLRTIRRQDEDGFVPHLSVTLGVALALASLAVLIYFIHHVAVTIQADAVVARVGSELLDAIDTLFPESGGAPADADPAPTAGNGLPAHFDADAEALAARGGGYLQQVDVDALVDAAAEADLLLRLECRPGQFVVEGQALLRCWPPGRLDDDRRRTLQAALVLGSQRTAVQDVEFTVSQLVEIAVRALSPGINDPFTAVASIDRLGAALHRLARRDLPSPRRLDPDGRLRVVTPVISFGGVLDTALAPIRQNARDSSVVLCRLLEAIDGAARVARRPHDREALRTQAMLVIRAARRNVPEVADRDRAEALHAQVLEHLRAPPPEARPG